MTQYQKLYKKVKEILDKNNLEYTCEDNERNRIIVKTKIGEWIVIPDKDRYSKVWTIFSRFEDEKSIPEYLIDNFNVNTFSGKMNFHTMTMDAALNDFEYAVNLIAS